ncbi:MAG: SIS domain-containing protein, partial [Betaproteobacteria bacterium]|nr:SIS domain-containing protein [Betaproteobacteria bacterium]
TSVGNDYGFEHIFARQVEALCGPNDVLVGISTSGNSGNVIRAVEEGRRLGLYTVGLLGGDGGKLAALCDFTLIAPASDTPRIQEVHILIGHIVCELLEA